jgi:hypothetical protein
MDHCEKMKRREEAMRKAWNEDHPDRDYDVWMSCAATEEQAEYAEHWMLVNLAKGRFWKAGSELDKQ